MWYDEVQVDIQTRYGELQPMIREVVAVIGEDGEVQHFPVADAKRWDALGESLFRIGDKWVHCRETALVSGEPGTLFSEEEAYRWLVRHGFDPSGELPEMAESRRLR